MRQEHEYEGIQVQESIIDERDYYIGYIVLSRRVFG